MDLTNKELDQAIKDKREERLGYIDYRDRTGGTLANKMLSRDFDRSSWCLKYLEADKRVTQATNELDHLERVKYYRDEFGTNNG